MNRTEVTATKATTGYPVDRAPERSRTVSPEFVEKLRNLGASDSTIKLAKQHVSKTEQFLTKR